MKRIFFILSILCLVNYSSFAAPRSYSQARSIAMSFASKLGIDIPQINEARKAYSDVNEPYYIFNLGENKGFTIISGDDEMPEVVGYSTVGNLDMDNMPKGLEELLQQYKMMLTSVRSGNEDALRTVDFCTRSARNASSEVVAPLIKSTWGQGSPYNDLCPTMSDGTRCASGCVATAMAQVLNYYKYPSELLDDLPAFTTQSQGFYMPGISKGETYAWDDMRNTYNGNYAPAQGEAVAKLMLHCGYAVHMNYGYESGASSADIPNAMQNYFGFDKELVGAAWRDAYTIEEWTGILNRELVNGRPVLYSGSGSGSMGHQFILDGVDKYGYYHINWGWDGSCDGYFDISIMNPSGGSAEDGYTNNVLAIVGLTPDNGVADEKLVEESSVSLTEFAGIKPTISYWKTIRTDESDVFTGGAVPHVTNIGRTPVKYLFSMGIKDKDGTVVNIGSNTCELEMNPGSAWYFTIHWSYAIPVGTDQIYVVYSKDEGSTWEIVPGFAKYPHRIITTETRLYHLSNTPGIVVPTNKEVDNLDVLGIVNRIQFNNIEGLDIDAADANLNGIVNCCDIVAAVNIIKGKNNNSNVLEDKVKLDLAYDAASSGNGGFLRISMANPEMEITALEATITLPNGYSISKDKNEKYVIALNRNRLYDTDSLYDDHIISCVWQYDNTYRIIAYSNNNIPFKDVSGELLKVHISGPSTPNYIRLRNFVFASPTGEGCLCDGLSFNAPNNNYAKTKSDVISDIERKTLGEKALQNMSAKEVFPGRGKKVLVK